MIATPKISTLNSYSYNKGGEHKKIHIKGDPMNYTTNEKVIEIREDKDKLNSFIEAYKPFVASTVQKKIGKFVAYGKDEELQIGLIAFLEAINSYDIQKGNFIPLHL